MGFKLVMAFYYKFRLKGKLTKKLDNFVNFKLRMNRECQLLSRIMFGYNKLEEDEDEEEIIIVERMNKQSKTNMIRTMWKRKKYQQI